MSYALDVETIGRERARDLLATPYVFNEREVTETARTDADIIVCHMGLTTGGSIGVETALKLAQCPELIDVWSAAVLAIKADAVILCHVGPIAELEDAAFVLTHALHCHGFYASSTGRLPVAEQTKKFKAIQTYKVAAPQGV